MSESLDFQAQGAGGKKNTFVVQIRFQQNQTWQGSIVWVNQRKTEQFRSKLELLELMRSAIGADAVETVFTFPKEEEPGAEDNLM